ncbi:MAG: hypothetical protein JXA37_13655, partial [Chloroflexia bacterium]|nr:hypothetical protein [Chloroflexia bacterium]
MKRLGRLCLLALLLPLALAGGARAGRMQPVDFNRPSPVVQGEAWQIELVDRHGTVGEFNSLALDTNDRPHISYWDRDLWVLKY